MQGVLRGEAVRRSLDLTNWEAANREIQSWEIYGEEANPRIGEAFERFIAQGVANGLSIETTKKQRLLQKEMVAYFDVLPIRSISTDDLAKFRESWKLSSITARKKIERLRSFFKFCIGRKWIEDNPASALRVPKETSVEKKPYEKAELEKIAWAIPLFPDKGIYRESNKARIGAFVAVLRWTGLRIRDVVQLKKSQVEGERIVLRTHKNQRPVKLILHPDVKMGLESVKNPGDYFFWSGLGNPKSCVGDWQRTFRRLSKLAGVHIHAHRWRHTFATDLLSKGVPVSEVAAILGNSPRIIEKHYSQWIQARQDAVEKAIKATWA